MKLTVEHSEVGANATLITLSGKLLLGPECKELESLIPSLITSGRTTLVFDLSGLAQIDSTGMGRFIDTYSRLRKRGGEMRLAGVEGAVKTAFRVTRLDGVFSFYPTVEEACRGLRPSEST